MLGPADLQETGMLLVRLCGQYRTVGVTRGYGDCNIIGTGGKRGPIDVTELTLLEALRVGADGVPHKLCVKCKRVLPMRAFHKDATRPDGVFVYCMECRRRLSRAKA